MTQYAELVTKLKADNTDFNAKMNESTASAGSFTDKVSKGAAATSAALAAVTAAAAAIAIGFAALDESSKRLDKLAKSAERLGVNASQLKNLSVAADILGSSSGSLEMLLGKMNIALGGLQLGSDKAKESFKALGLSAKDFIGLNTEQSFTLIAQRLRNLGDIQLQAKIGTELFGKSFKDNLGFINSDIDGTIDKFKSFGLQLTDNQIKAVSSFQDTREMFGKVWEGFSDKVMAELAPAAKDMLDKLAQQIQEWGGLDEVAKKTASSIEDAFSTIRDLLNYITDNNAFKILMTATEGWITTIQKAISALGGLKQYLMEAANGISRLEQSVLTNYYGKNYTVDVPMQSTLPQISQFREEELQRQSDQREKQKEYALALEREKRFYEERSLVAEKEERKQAQFNQKVQEATDAAKNKMIAMAKATGEAETKLIKLTQIADKLASKQEKEISKILDDVINNPDTENKNYKPMAEVTEEFKRYLSDIIQDVKAGDKDVSFEIGKLEQSIAEAQKNGDDTSALEGVLKETLSFVKNQNSAEQQKLDIQIRVQSSEDLVTKVTSSANFRRKIEQQVQSTLAQAAR
jgi:hypothetical protein